MDTEEFATVGIAACPTCHRDMRVEYTDVDVAWVWHGVHCGWGHTVFSEDVRGFLGLLAMPERVCSAPGEPMPPG